MRPALVLACLALAGAPASPELRAQSFAPPALDAAFDELWASADSIGAERAIERILALGAPFDTLLARVQAGPLLHVGVPRGRLAGVHRAPDGSEFPYLVAVPDDYDPARRYPLRVYLHGAVNAERRDGYRIWDLDRHAGPDHIAVFPAAWRGAAWWRHAQVENLRAILADLRRTYNVDENRVHLIGVSDGATGGFWLGSRDPTPWAGLVSLIGHPAVLANPASGVESPWLPANLRALPILAYNGDRDPLYPAFTVVPFVEELRRLGVRIDFRRLPNAGHEVSWWPDERGRIERFLRDRIRDPLPDEIVWETDDPARHGRAFWLVVDRIDPAPDGAPARVEARRRGNRFEIRADRAPGLRLLLSPGEADLRRPVTVICNGRTVHDRPVTPDPATLLRRAAADRDRTAPIGAELPLSCPPP